MKRKLIPCLLALALAASLAPSALAAQPPAVCYPTSVTRSEDGTQIRKVYELGPEEDPAGIPRSDFEQEGFHYTLTDLLKQEAPEQETRYHWWSCSGCAGKDGRIYQSNRKRNQPQSPLGRAVFQMVAGRTAWLHPLHAISRITEYHPTWGRTDKQSGPHHF